MQRELRPDGPATPEMVTLARESRGITQSKLAAALGTSQGHLSKIEAGSIPASPELISDLAGILGYPETFFYQRDRVYGPSVSEFFHRKRATASIKALNQVHARINIRRLHIARLLRAGEVEDKFPRIDPDEFGGDIEEVARAARAIWQIPPGPVRNLIEVIENAGGIVIRLNLGAPKIDAVSWWVPGLPPMFVVSDKISADRERHTLAHELGHIIMHSDVRPHMEQEADRFAGAFLTPAEDIKRDLLQPSIHSLAGLKPKWRVSMQSLLVRAKQLGTINEAQATYLWRQLSAAGYRLREPAELDFPKEEPTLLQELLELHVEELGYSLRDLADMLCWTEEELRANYRIGTHTPGNRPHLRVLG